MRTTGKTKRELAVSAALIGAAAAQVRCEAEHAVLTTQEAGELDFIGRRLHAIAESLFEQAAPGAARTVFAFDVARRPGRRVLREDIEDGFVDPPEGGLMPGVDVYWVEDGKTVALP